MKKSKFNNKSVNSLKYLRLFLIMAMMVVVVSMNTGIKISAEETLTINYLYLENKVISTPNVERILIDYGVEDASLLNPSISIKNYTTGEIKTYESISFTDGVALYEIQYTDADTGIYEVIGFENAGLKDIYFGVNIEFSETTDEALAVTEDDITDLMEDVYGGDGIQTEETGSIDWSPIEYSIVTLGANATEITTTDIGDIAKAIETVREENGFDQTIVSEDEEPRKYVVAIDPGHDISHAGARANGLKEEYLTLSIAKYCVEELGQYPMISVYMTRDTMSCLTPGTKSQVCNKTRVTRSAEAGADIFVSIHLNSSTRGTTSGAEVYYPNANGNAEIGGSGKALASQIQSQLVALGLNNGGIKIRNSEAGDSFPDGTLMDYYGVIRHAKSCGFPGVIVEHAYLTNGSDAAFLSNEENLRQLGIADATGIANYLGVTKDDTISEPVNADRAQVEAFVTRLYEKCLNRYADATGLKDWTDNICSGKLTGVETAAGFFFSPELERQNLSNQAYVDTLYNVFLDRAPDAGGLSDWVYKLDNGCSRYGVFMGFANSNEYKEICKKYGIKQGNAKYQEGRDRNLGLTTFVSRLYTKALQRGYDTDGLNYWCNQICDEKWSIMDTSTTGFFESGEFIRKNTTNEEYVAILYQTFFDRDYDQTGFDMWVSHLNNGMSRKEVLSGFANSAEFARLKASYGL